MKKLDGIVGQYLEMDTNYAMIITGPWGSGKTHYYQTVLNPLISESPLATDVNKKYIPIKISLFGINSIEDVQSQILLSLFPPLKNKNIKLAANIGKALLKGVLKMNGFGDIYDIASEVEIDKSDLIKFSDLVLVFDDLERTSKSFEIADFIGFTNSLVESENVKIILIANEDKIDDKIYFSIKEKVIGTSIEFIPNYSDSYDGIIKKFDSFPTYKLFLEDKKNFILNVFGKVCKNLRILLITLSYFQKIHCAIVNDIESISALKKKQDEILQILLQFSIAIMIEFKECKITFNDKKEIDQFNYSLNLLFPKTFGISSAIGKDEDDKIPYRESFMSKYYSETTNYKFFSSIYDFITGGNVLESESIVLELKEFYHISNDILQPQYELLSQLKEPECYSFSDINYVKSIRKMLNYADLGMYNLEDYCYIYYLATRFSNLLSFDPNNLKRRILKGIKKGKANYLFNPILERHLSTNEESTYKTQLDEIKNLCMQINDSIKTTSSNQKYKELEHVCYNDFEMFYSQIFQNYSSEPVLQNFNPNKFYNFYNQSSNQIKAKVSAFFYLRYHTSPYELREEKVFLEKFKTKINFKSSNDKKKTLSQYQYSVLNDKLDTVIEKIRHHC